MDPHANLTEQARLLGSEDRADRRRLSALRQALQDWLTSGGFAPDWAAHPAAAAGYRRWCRNMIKFQDLHR